MKFVKFIAMGLLLWILPLHGIDSLQKVKKVKTLAIVGSAASMTAVHVGLYHAWYKDYSMGKFHFFDDSKEWNQIDKLGHAYWSFTMTKIAYQGYHHVGFNHRTSLWLGIGAAALFQMPIEVLDGFSSGWGASWSDALANTAGIAFASIQLAKWKEVKIPFKWSFARTSYAAMRPNVLGKGIFQEWLKDYNGQTYWIGVFPGRWINTKHFWPKWLGVDIGYGAEGMLGGFGNSWTSGGVNYQFDHIPRYRQWYVSPAIDWNYVFRKSKYLKPVGFLLEHIRLPMPTIEFNKKSNKFHWLKL